MSKQQPQTKNDRENSEDQLLSKFLDRLTKLSPGDLAILKRNAGATIGESRGALGLFYKILPSGEKVKRDEEIFFLVCTLKGLNKYSLSGNFGTTMRRLKQAQKTTSESIDRRMKLLLDCQFDALSNGRNGGGALAHRLRQYVKLAASKEIGVDWKQLLRDLRRWSHPQRFIQKQWARSFFGEEYSYSNSKSEVKPQTEVTKSEQSEKTTDMEEK